MSGDVFGNGMLLPDAPARRRLRPPPRLHRSGSGPGARRSRSASGCSSSPARRGTTTTATRSPRAAASGRARRRASSCPPRRAPRSASRTRRSRPTEVIRAILRAPVDLLWNGGIGTVVKASTETDADALDRSCDAIRVDASELRCRVIGEGGNLGLTQRARIEFAARRRARQRRLHRQLGRRRLLRPRGQPEDPARPRGARAASSTPPSATSCCATSPTTSSRTSCTTRSCRRRSSPRRSAARPGGCSPTRTSWQRSRSEGLLDRDVEAPAELGRDGRAPARGPRARAARARGPAGVRQARLTDALLRSRPARTSRSSSATLRGYFPPRGRRALRPPARRAPAAARARRDDRRQRRGRRDRADVRLAASWPSSAPSPPTSCAPTAIAREVDRRGGRWEAIERLGRAVDRGARGS